MNGLLWPTDEQIERLRPFFPGSHGKPRADDRRMLSGIVFVNRNGLLSKAMPVSLMAGDQERWLTASAEEAVSLLGPYPSQLTKMV